MLRFRSHFHPQCCFFVVTPGLTYKLDTICGSIRAIIYWYHHDGNSYIRVYRLWFQKIGLKVMIPRHSMYGVYYLHLVSKIFIQI